MRRKEYERFLKTTNEKDALFLDVVIPANTIHCPESSVCQYDGRNFKDPTKQVLAKHAEVGDGAIYVAQGVPSFGGACDVRMWRTGKIESTPHGHFAKLMSASTGGSESDAKTAARSTNFKIDHFDYPVGKEAINAEFPKGKRTDFGYLPFKVGGGELRDF